MDTPNADRWRPIRHSGRRASSIRSPASGATIGLFFSNTPYVGGASRSHGSCDSVPRRVSIDRAPSRTEPRYSPLNIERTALRHGGPRNLRRSGSAMSSRRSTAQPLAATSDTGARLLSRWRWLDVTRKVNSLRRPIRPPAMASLPLPPRAISQHEFPTSRLSADLRTEATSYAGRLGQGDPEAELPESTFLGLSNTFSSPERTCSRPRAHVSPARRARALARGHVLRPREDVLCASENASSRPESTCSGRRARAPA